MAERLLFRQILRRWQPNAASPKCKITLNNAIYEQKCCYTTAANGENYEKEKNNQWLILPPFTTTADGSSIGKKLYGRPDETNTTALKWILKCCPHLPRSLVQKLFRLRQVHFLIFLLLGLLNAWAASNKLGHMITVHEMLHLVAYIAWKISLKTRQFCMIIISVKTNYSAL